MFLIVDINVASHVLLNKNNADFKPIREAIYKAKSAKLVHGGYLTEEYARTTEVYKVILLLDRMGLALKVPDATVNTESKAVRALGICQSNDQHIIALARVSGARLLCTDDHDLHTDFTNKKLIDTPRGKIYQNASHSNLIRRFCDSGKLTP